MERALQEMEVEGRETNVTGTHGSRMLACLGTFLLPFQHAQNQQKLTAICLCQ